MRDLLLMPIRRIGRDLADAARWWDRFWLAPQSPATACLLRWLAGAMFLYTHGVWSLALDEFFTSDGWQPAGLVEQLRAGTYHWSYWWSVPDEYIWPVHLAGLAVLFAFWIGWLTPVTSKLAAVIVISYANRVPLANFGLDQINGMLALYLAIAPCGAMWSVDALWRRRPQPTAAAGLAMRLIQVHLCLIYIYAGLAKLKGEAWWNGEAIWMTLANEEYQSLDLTWLAYAPRLTEALTHATVLWELTFWALVWRPRLRPYVLAIGTAMHLGIGAFLGMWTFGLIMTVAYVAFLPVDRLLYRTSTEAAS